MSPIAHRNQSNWVFHLTYSQNFSTFTLVIIPLIWFDQTDCITVERFASENEDFCTQCN